MRKMWDKLGAPLDLVDKNKYGAEKSLQWKFIPVKKEKFASSGDNEYW